jgi:phosphoribosylamine--glycine ligase
VKILVLGSGGREHALVWRLRRDPDVTEVLAAPGNPGMRDEARCVAADLADPASLLALARAERVGLTVVGPEAPLERGIADLFRAENLPILGPSRRAAALEWSKSFAKNFMSRHAIPTARFAVCETVDAAMAVIAEGAFGFPLVIKADGLAAGKGVVLAGDRAEAEAAVRASMLDGQFGDAGATVVIEECLTGPEVSFFALCDGRRAVPLSTAEDHKRIWDDDRGLNTGGMGAFAPSPRVTPALSEEIMRRIVNPVLSGMLAEGAPYVGFLYAGLMLTDSGPKVIEFNVRFGDPEAQVVLPQLEGRVAHALLSAARGHLPEAPSFRVSPDRTVGVVIASAGYPASSDTGRRIHGLDGARAVPNALVFHSGTRGETGAIDTAGGRVLTVVGRGPTYVDAMATAYAALGFIRFEGMQFRRDIGKKALTATVGVFS